MIIDPGLLLRWYAGPRRQSLAKGGSGPGPTPLASTGNLHTRPGLPLYAYTQAEDMHHGRPASRFFIFRTSRGCEYLDLALPHPGAERGQLAAARVAASKSPGTAAIITG